MAKQTIEAVRWMEPSTLEIERHGSSIKRVDASAVLAGGHKYHSHEIDRDRDEVLVHSCPKNNRAPTTTHVFNASGGSKGSRGYKKP
jgi:hypothetical protein